MRKRLKSEIALKGALDGKKTNRNKKKNVEKLDTHAHTHTHSGAQDSTTTHHGRWREIKSTYGVPPDTMSGFRTELYVQWNNTGTTATHVTAHNGSLTTIQSLPTHL